MVAEKNILLTTNRVYDYNAILIGRRENGKLHIKLGRTAAEVGSRWLPTAAASVRGRAECGVCCGQRGTGEGFLRVLRFPL
jgi:hypothetical protein